MKSINALCTEQSPHLAKLYAHSRHLSYLTRCVQSWLPAPLNQHVTVANFQQNVLVLHVDSAVWANQLRFMTGQIKQQWQQRLSSQYSPIQQVKIKVQAVAVATTPAAEPKNPLSAKSITLLQSVADTTTDAPLKAAFERLLAHAHAKE